MKLRRTFFLSSFALSSLAFVLLLPACDTLTPADDPFGKIYENATFQECADCHAPGAPGRSPGIEATQDWSTRDRAFSTLHGNASGLEGNFAGCNGVPLVGPTSSQSLIIAYLDSNVRKNFSNPDFPNCTPDAISDAELHLMNPVDPQALQDLKDFIDAGGFE